jgi:hypothetical protein
MIKYHELVICSYKAFRKSAVIMLHSGKLGNTVTEVTGHNVAEKNWILVGRRYRDFTSKCGRIGTRIFFPFFERSSCLTNATVVIFLWQSFINNKYRQKSYSEADFCIKIYIRMGGMALITFTQPKTPIRSTSSELDKC